MRWLAGFFLLLALALAGGYIFVKGYPYRLYSGWVNGEEWNRFYRIDGYQKYYLTPTQFEEPLLYNEDYPQLWKVFPLNNSQIPLPTRHPMFLTIPMVEIRPRDNTPFIGMVLTGPDKREISRVYTLPTTLARDYTLGQELFKLPFVRNRIMKLDSEELWKEVFTRKITVESKSMEEMIRDLYILHVRSKLLPPGTLRYGLLKDSKAMIELTSVDKDYVVELILSQQNGGIYSYILKTAKNNGESMKLRSKFLESISFSPIDPGLGRILYTEFKQLNFARQVDQEGLLYLFSAWSQEIDRVDLLKEMIFFLERGRTNGMQLKALYQYVFRKYGKTFTTRNILTDIDDQDLLLQRNIELENIEKKHAAEREMNNRVVPVPELSNEEKMREHLRKAKEGGPSESDDVTVH